MLRNVRLVGTIGFATALACAEKPATEVTTPQVVPPANAFVASPLVADAAPFAPAVDQNLQEPWGLAVSTSGVLWVANRHTGTSTLYDPDGTVRSRVVTLPRGTPTGIVSSSSSDFMIARGPARWIFASESGVITAWNPSSDTAQVVVEESGAIFKGLAIASVEGSNRIYATNFRRGVVEMFNGSFERIGEFTDPSLPTDYAPFGIQTVNGRVLVTFAKQQAPDNADDEAGIGNGFIDVFTTAGEFVSRFASNGTLNSPWGIAVAPGGFGPFANHILVGNFGDGLINVFDQNGRFVDVIRDANRAPLAIGGLWGISFGVGAASNTLYFVGCPNPPESLGLLGSLKAR